MLARKLGFLVGALMFCGLIGIECADATKAPQLWGGPAWMWGVLAAICAWAFFAYWPKRLGIGYISDPSATFDARGATYEVVSFHSAGLGLRGVPDAVRHDVQKAGGSSFQSKIHLRRPDVRLMVALALLIAAMYVCYGLTFTVLMFHVFLATMLVATFGPAINESGRMMSAAFLRHGHCPACTYDLKSLSPQPDGAVVCPECGHAWSLIAEGVNVSKLDDSASASVLSERR